MRNVVMDCSPVDAILEMSYLASILQLPITQVFISKGY